MCLIFAMTSSRPGKYLKMKESPGKFKNIPRNLEVQQLLYTNRTIKVHGTPWVYIQV